MVDTVAFSLFGALGAYGGPAGYSRRGTETKPTRSALLGLCASALGIQRTDGTALESLSTWRFLVASIEPRQSRQRVIRDFHTAQTVHRKVRKPRTRREAMLAGHRDNAIHTEITERDYLTDCAFAIAVWGGDTEALARALKCPAFAPYLGRKSCPLAAPMDPRIATVDAPWQAFNMLQCPPWFGEGCIQEVTCDPLGFGHTGSRVVSTSHSFDDPVDRSTWSFHRRAVETRRLEPPIMLRAATPREEPA